MNCNYFYLHGFASSPQSIKAQYLCDRFTELGLYLHILDLNQGDFTHLTLSRQIQQVATTLPPTSTPVTLIGSSFGGLTAAWVAQQYPQVQRLILLAPAFHVLDHWLPKLGKSQVQQWQDSGYLSIYHYGEKRFLPLDYQFVIDASQYSESQLQRPIPTLILHGINDEVIPIQSSRDYARLRPWVNLLELPSDHGLGDVLSQIWQHITTWKVSED